MKSGQKQVVLGKGEKERRKRRKEKRKKKGRKNEKKKKKKRKKGKKGWGKQTEIKNQTKTNKTKQNTGEYLLILYTLSPLTSPGTGPSSSSSGGGACCADFQVLALGGAALPLPSAGLSGGCLPHEAPGRIATVVAGARIQQRRPRSTGRRDTAQDPASPPGPAETRRAQDSKDAPAPS